MKEIIGQANRVLVDVARARVRQQEPGEALKRCGRVAGLIDYEQEVGGNGV